VEQIGFTNSWKDLKNALEGKMPDRRSIFCKLQGAVFLVGAESHGTQRPLITTIFANLLNRDTAFLDLIVEFCSANLLECIAQRIRMILNYRGLEKVADSVEGLVRQKSAGIAATERYDTMVKEVFLHMRRPAA
jgi:hypothetical protein